MARPTSKQKSELSRALVDLRTAYGESQQAFANRLGVALQTVARWEMHGLPSGFILLKLAELAENKELDGIYQVFLRAVLDEIHRVGVKESSLATLFNSLGSVEAQPITKVMSEMGRKGGKASAKARMTKLTPEQRSEIARKAAAKSAEVRSKKAADKKQAIHG